MKWKVEKVQEDKRFKPFSVTLTFTTREEYVYFHDNVMTLLKPNGGPDPLYGAIFQMGNGKSPNQDSGEI